MLESVQAAASTILAGSGTEQSPPTVQHVSIASPMLLAADKGLIIRSLTHLNKGRIELESAAARMAATSHTHMRASFGRCC
jgi:hypothetical protein